MDKTTIKFNEQEFDIEHGTDKGGKITMSFTPAKKGKLSSTGKSNVHLSTGFVQVGDFQVNVNVVKTIPKAER